MAIDLKLIGESYAKLYDILENNIKVGYILLKENNNKSITIESLSVDIKHQRKGIGREVVNKLKEKHSFIHGASSPMAINFWKKVDAEFEYYVNDDMVYQLLNIGEYPPFIIKC